METWQVDYKMGLLGSSPSVFGNFTIRWTILSVAEIFYEYWCFGKISPPSWLEGPVWKTRDGLEIYILSSCEAEGRRKVMRVRKRSRPSSLPLPFFNYHFYNIFIHSLCHAAPETQRRPEACLIKTEWLILSERESSTERHCSTQPVLLPQLPLLDSQGHLQVTFRVEEQPKGN